jgi:hypothetical protein
MQVAISDLTDVDIVGLDSDSHRHTLIMVGGNPFMPLEGALNQISTGWSTHVYTAGI